jgi:hypothetical protein
MPILAETPMDIDLELVSAVKIRWNSGENRRFPSKAGKRLESKTLR